MRHSVSVLLAAVVSCSSHELSSDSLAEMRQAIVAPGAGGPAYLVKDLAAQPASEWRFEAPHRLVTAGAQMFFVARDPVHGEELWKTDGTAGGTVLVRDLAPGSQSSTPDRLIAAGERVYFVINNRELWTSDGTLEGTRLVGIPSPNGALGDMAAWNGMIFVSAVTPEHGQELFVGDATGAPMRHFDLRPGTANSSPVRLVAGPDALYFFATDEEHGRELWRSDGTVEGTHLVIDLSPGAAYAVVDDVSVLDGTLFFSLQGAGGHYAIWSSDGTAEGTRAYATPDCGAYQSRPRELTHAAGKLFFRCEDANGLYRLWTSDGTPDGTHHLTDSSASTLTAAGDRLYFFGRHPDSGAEIWTSDGTPEGTRLVKDLVPGTGNVDAGDFTAVGASLFFTRSNRQELWATDGTEAGTRLLRAVRLSGSSDWWSPAMIVMGGEAYFAAYEGGKILLWSSDGTEDGTRVVRPALWGTASSQPRTPVALGGRLLLGANTPGEASDLWSSDGTADGTLAITTATGVALRGADNLTRVGDRIFFSANDGQTGAEVWRTDGTSAGTELVKDIAVGTSPAYPSTFIEFEGSLLFTARDAANTYRLWRSDGTADGTQPIADVFMRNSFARAGNRVFFVGWPNGGSDGLWITDGTAEGTRQIATDAQWPKELTAVGDRLFFVAEHPTSDRELWTSDGTPEGTRLVKDIHSGFAYGPQRLVAFGDRLFFLGETEPEGRSLWTSDGTAEGTNLFLDLEGNLSRGGAGVIGDTLYLHLLEQGGVVANRGLWKSDGTVQGTQFVKALDAATDFVQVGGLVIFAGSDASGTELWATDGTEEGTRRIAETFPGAGNGSVGQPVVLGTKVLFPGYHDDVGRELFALELQGTQALAAEAETDEDVAKTITLAATSPRGTGLTFAVVEEPTHGTLSLSDATATYTPEANWSGTDAFSFRANDGAYDSDPATVTIVVAPVNDAPTWSEAPPGPVVADVEEEIALVFTAADVDADVLSYELDNEPEGAAIDAQTGTFSWTPTVAQSGEHLLTVIASDGQLTVTHALTLVVHAPSPVDAGEEPVDAGEEPVDAGEEPVDAGEEPVDAGEELVDAGEEPVDAGEEPVDAGGEPVDAGTDQPSPPAPGCGCAGEPVTGAMLLMGLAGLVRRRRGR